MLEILIPAAAIIVFFGILYFGLKKTKPAGPYADGPDFVPLVPAPPPVPVQTKAHVVEEQIIVVGKKKKYYHKKKKTRKRKLT